MKFKNTLQKGSVRYIVFREQSTWYAVALEFNIVEEGDDPREVLIMLFEAIAGYIKSARKIGARPHILNQRPDREYEDLWSALRAKNTAKIPQDLKVYTFWERPLAVAAV